MKIVRLKRRNECKIELMKAIHAARYEIKKVDKNGSNSGRKHIHIDDVLDVIRGPFYKNNLVTYSRRILGKDYIPLYRTTIEHTLTGQNISDTRIFDASLVYSEYGKKMMNGMQAGGSFETYTRRYALMSLLALQGEEDTDGSDYKEKEYKKSKSVTVNAEPDITHEMLELLISKRNDAETLRNYILEQLNVSDIKLINQKDINDFYKQLSL